MKFFDSFKIAFHNIINNKSRSILTTIIVFIVSILIMGLTTFGIVFKSNITEASKEVFKENGTSYRLESNNGKFTEDEIDKFSSLTDKYDVIIDTINFESYQLSVYSSNETRCSYKLIDFKHYNIKQNDLIIDGRIWGTKDSKQKNVWVSNSFVKSLAQKNQYINIGDELKLNFNVYLEQGEYIEKQDNYIIQGIYDKNKLDDTENFDVIIDYNTVINNYGYDIINSIQMFFNLSEKNYDFDQVYKMMQDFDSDMKSTFGKNYSNYGSYERFSCSFLDEMKMNNLMTTLIIGVTIILSFIILLLSIGSVANTIIISVDKNRKFIGLMKALGLNEKGVKRMISIEAFLDVFFGILLSTICLYVFLQPVLLTILNQIIKSMFGYYHLNYVATIQIPVIIPMVTLIVFYLMAILFSKGSLIKIASQDVIETISEVA